MKLQPNLNPNAAFNKGKLDRQLLPQLAKATSAPKMMMSDKVSFSSTWQAQQVFYRRMGQQLGHDFSSVEPAENKPLFDVEEITKNVMGFVRGYIFGAKADGADDEQLHSLFNDAQKGIARGIADASKELEDGGWLNDDIKNGIGQTRQRLGEEMDNLHRDLFGEDDSSTGNLPLNGSFFQQQQYRLANSSALTIQTAEGDVVTINFASNYRLRQQQSEDSVFSQQHYREQFAYTVDGDLNEQEQAAITSLLADITKVSDEFFNGDLQTAYEQAQQLGINSDQLVSFNLQLQQVASYQGVTTAGPRFNDPARQYQAVQNPEQSILGQLAKPFAGVHQLLTDLADKAQANRLQQLLVPAFDWINQQQPKTAGLLDYAHSLWRDQSGFSA